MNIIIRIFLFILVIGCNKGFAQDTIYWHPNYKLTWNDFQGIPDTASKNDASSFPGIRYHLHFDEDSFSTQVTSYFIKSRSWVKIKNNDTLLLHEQGHFDINELFARKLRKAFAAYQFNAQTVKKDIKELFVLNQQEKEKMNIQYDKETNYSQDQLQQLSWQKKIQTELNVLEKYTSK